FASSIPSSQIQAQGDSQDDDELASETAGLNLDGPITTQRLAIFRSALGQLLNTPLFEDDSANVDDLVSAVNRRVGSSGSDSFNKEEAIKALKKMDEAAQIM